MAQVHGVAGEWARVRGTVNGLMPLFISIFALGFSAALLVFVWHQVGSLLVVLSLCAVAWCLVRGERRMENYFKGARGEEHVAGILRSLPDEYHVFNDFVACGSHVDHVIVGPSGVFAIETKFWRGKVTIEEEHILVDDQLPDRDPLAQVLKESSLVKTELVRKGWKGTVTPILAFASNTFSAKIAELRGAVILNASTLSDTLTTGRNLLVGAEIERLAQLMETDK